MKQYELDVVNARKNKLDKRFGNSIVEHARVLTREIILDAKHRVRILSDSFNEFFYSKLEKNIVNFLQEDNKNIFELIVSEEKRDNSLIDKLKNQFPEQFQVKYIPQNQFPKDDESGEYVNYIVNDHNAFRYEYSDRNIQHGVVKAIANFNHQDDSAVLNNMFEEIQKIA